MRNRDGSYATQATRARTLRLIAEQLYSLGYKKLHATELMCFVRKVCRFAMKGLPLGLQETTSGFMERS